MVIMLFGFALLSLRSFPSLSSSAGIPNVFLTRSRARGGSASLAQNTDYGDGAVMTTAKGGEEEQCKTWEADCNFLEIELTAVLTF